MRAPCVCAASQTLKTLNSNPKSRYDEELPIVAVLLVLYGQGPANTVKVPEKK